MDEVSSLESLGRKVAEQQDAMLASEDLRRARPVLRARAPRRPRPLRIVSLAVAAAVVIAVGVRAFGPKPEGALTFRVGTSSAPASLGTWLSANASKEATIRFSDGTTIVLDPGARARVVRVDRLGADLVLEGGLAHAAFVPNRGGRWKINVGPFVVAVTGTRFDVVWRPDEDLFELSLQSGKVSLSGCAFGESRPLQAGETARAWCRQNRFEIAKRTATTESMPPPIEPARPPTEAAGAASPSDEQGDKHAVEATHRGSLQTSTDYRELIRAGKYREAMASLAGPAFAATCARADLTDLEALARAARLAGDLTEAGAAYRTLRSRFPRTNEAAVAAFYIGRMDFDGRAAYAEAAPWFRVYLRERPAGSLAREALGRLMEALERSGDRAGATKIANEYLSAYPSGPHAELARTLSRTTP